MANKWKGLHYVHKSPKKPICLPTSRRRSKPCDLKNKCFQSSLTDKTKQPNFSKVFQISRRHEGIGALTFRHHIHDLINTCLAREMCTVPTWHKLQVVLKSLKRSLELCLNNTTETQIGSYQNLEHNSETPDLQTDACSLWFHRLLMSLKCILRLRPGGKGLFFQLLRRLSWEDSKLKTFLGYQGSSFNLNKLSQGEKRAHR